MNLLNSYTKGTNQPLLENLISFLDYYDFPSEISPLLHVFIIVCILCAQRA